MTLRKLLEEYGINPEDMLDTVVGLPDLPGPGRITVSADIRAQSLSLEIGIHLSQGG